MSATTSAASPLYVSSEQGRKLRVVLVSPPRAPAWISATLDLAVQDKDIALSLLPIDAIWSLPAPQLPVGMRMFLRTERWFLRHFLRLAGREDASQMAFVRIDAKAGADDLPTVDSSALDNIDAVRRKLEAAQPDLVILHGPPEWSGTLAECAPHGCWRLDESLVAPVHAGATLLEPILDGRDASGFALQLCPSEDGEPETLAQTWGATRAVSFSQQRDLAFAKLPAMLLRGLRKLVGDAGSDSRGVVRRLCVAKPQKPFAANAGSKAFGITLKLIWHWRSRRYRANQPWFVVVREEASVIDIARPRIGRVRSVVAPGDDYWADPFPFVQDGRQWLFVEEYVAALCKGVIRLLEVLPDGNVTRHGIVLEEASHLSFPQVWGKQGNWWMTVESAEGGKVSLYRSSNLSGGWQCMTNLIEGRECVDPTLYEHAGHWYLFVNVAECGGNPSDELFLFTADSMDGPYQPHPCNPVVSDVRSARMAGRVFVDAQGRLIRPAQCCAPIYGSAVIFNEVIELTPSTYRERALSRLDVSDSVAIDGCHTYNEHDGFEVLDMHGEPPPTAERAVVVEPDGRVIPA